MNQIKSLVLSFRIKFLFLIFKVTKSERVYNKVDYLVDLRIKNLQHTLSKSRWSKVRLQNDLDFLKNQEKQNAL